MRKILMAAAATFAIGLAGAANAGVFSYNQDFTAAPGAEWSYSATGDYVQDAGIFGELSSNTGGTNDYAPVSATLSLTSTGAGHALMTFDLLGFRTLDGTNGYEDLLSVIVNGTTVVQASYDLGGGGGSSFSGISIFASGVQDGRTVHISTPVNIVTGLNTFVFSYPNLQGYSDEAFGLDNVHINGDVTSPGPEPTSWALMLLGFGGIGAAIRNRRRTAALAA